jgi:PilZ domain-containing protein
MERDPKNAAFTRAPRYPLRIPLKYRSSGDPQWRETLTENVSRSGVLFRTDHPMPLQTPIEMLLALPAELADGGAAATVICRGRIVRNEAGRASQDDSTGDARPTVAATIVGYRLAHVQGNDPRRI